MTCKTIKIKIGQLFTSYRFSALLAAASLLATTGSVGQVVGQGPSALGQWSPKIDLPLIPVAMANLPNGKILCWSAYKSNMFSYQTGDLSPKQTVTCLFDPTTLTYSEKLVTETNHDMFCPGTNNLPNGDILVSGGQHSQLTSIYSWENDKWNQGPISNTPRGYQGNATLSDGSCFTLGGSWSPDWLTMEKTDKPGEIFRNSKWTMLGNVTGDLTVMEGTTPIIADGGNLEQESSRYRRDNHAWLWEAPNGKVFHAGPGSQMHWIDVNKQDGWVSAGIPRGDDNYSMTGSAVMYDIGKIMKIGGSTSYDGRSPGSKSIYTIDINQEDAVAVINNGMANFARTNNNTVVLPTGEVFIVGGLPIARIFSDKNAVLTPELWDPKAPNAAPKILAPMTIPRTYHSAAILMMDGRVLVGGGGLFNKVTIDHPDVEIYSPPYLFNSDNTLANRPLILDSPKMATVNGSIAVKTDVAIKEFSLVRMSSVTHSVNNEQRRVPLDFTILSSQDYNLKIPAATIAIPGYYMLFAIDNNGVPSIAKAIQINIVDEADTTEASLLATSPQTRYQSQKNNIPGKIEAEHYDIGGQGVSYFDVDEKLGDLNFRAGDIIDTNLLSDTNYKLCYMQPKEWVEYTVNTTAGTYDVYVYASKEGSLQEAAGKLRLKFDKVLLGEALEITNTKSWLDTKVFKISNVYIGEGENKVLRLLVGYLGMFDIDKIVFKETNDREGIIEQESQYITTGHGHSSANGNPEMIVSPNPVDDVMVIPGVAQGTKFELYNLSGKKVLEKQEGNTMELKNLSPGTYLLKADGYQSAKIIKK